MNFIDWFVHGRGRVIEGIGSPAHLISSISTIVILLGLAVFLGIIFRGKRNKQDIVLRVAGIALIFLYVAKTSMNFITAPDPTTGVRRIAQNLLLFLCDLSIILVPIIGFGKGKVRDVCIDFMSIWGPMMGIVGTIGDVYMYTTYPVFSFYPLISLLNHTISGFVALFLYVSKLTEMSKRNIPYTMGVLTVTMLVALFVVHCVPYSENYMFFRHGAGTPYDFFKAAVNHNMVAYTILIFVFQHSYMVVFYLGYYGIVHIIEKVKEKRNAVRA